MNRLNIWVRNGSGTRPVGLFLPTNRFPSAAYADGRYGQAGIEESPPSSNARHFSFGELHPRFLLFSECRLPLANVLLF